jgi:hypothetical protein
VLTIVLLLGRAQLPIQDTIDVGIQEGYGGDLPELRHIHTPQESEHGSYRWTRETTTLVVPGVGKRAVQVQFALLPMSGAAAHAGASEVTVWTTSAPLATLPIRKSGAVYSLLVPAKHIPTGQLVMHLHSATFTPPDDPRQLGVPLDYVALHTLRSDSIVMPDWSAVGSWLIGLLLTFAIGLRVLDTRTATLLSSGAMLLMLLAAMLDPTRWAYGAQPALTAAILGYLLTLLLLTGLLPLARLLYVPLQTRTLGWLILVIVVAFGVRYGGRLYPQSMHGDIHFHTHRLFAAIGYGELFQLSHHRGVKIPYPPGGYLAVAPLILLFDDPRDALQWAAAMVEALSTMLVCFLVLWSLPNPTSRWSQRVSVVAAALYGLTAAGIMASWWSFDTHIYTQAAWLMLVAVLVYWGVAPRSLPFPHHKGKGDMIGVPVHTTVLHPDVSSKGDDGYPRRSPWVAAIIGVLLGVVFLGHVGFFVNTAAACGMLLLWVWWQSLRGNSTTRPLHVPLTLAYGGALAVVLVIFYSGYIPLVTTQLEVAASGGVAEVTEREPVSRLVLWRGLWEMGLIAHFGFFPLLLMPVGMGYLYTRYIANRNYNFPMLLVVMVCTTLVGLGFAILPFVTLSSASTRWLMFCAWAMAVGGALAFRLVWRCGWAGRVVVWTMGGFIAWNTLVYWVEPMLWRIRPPEPF